jgi:tetratricopeptide (TPR) repeat protein
MPIPRSRADRHLQDALARRPSLEARTLPRSAPHASPRALSSQRGLGRPVSAGTTRRGLCLAALLWTLAAHSAARANDFDQFQRARAAYESLRYDLAAELFRGLLADALPFDRRPLILESRKYLAATYLFLRRHEEAQTEFELLLRADQDYVLDPLAFPNEVVAKFAEVKTRLAEERSRSEEQRALSENQERARAELAERQQKLRLARLFRLASTSTIERRNSRWVAMVPFGAGQFQNGDQSLGLALAIGQGVLLSTSVVTFLFHESLRDEPPPAQPSDARLAESALRYTNQVSFGLFAALALSGVIDAQIRFKPKHVLERTRPLPPELRDFQVSVEPTGLTLSGHF